MGDVANGGCRSEDAQDAKNVLLPFHTRTAHHLLVEQLMLPMQSRSPV